MAQNPSNILICTVGGSHQPIITSIRELTPDYILFVCSEDDPATGKPGSYTQITGKGNVISAKPNEPPTLPNIPTQFGLRPDTFDVLLVPSDDLDTVVERIDKAMKDIKARFPGAHIIADYTGGTKSMTAGLVVVGLEYPNVELRFVTGARADLIKVHDGTQQSVAAPADRIRLQRQMAPYISAWRRFAYGEAYEGLSNISMPKDTRLRAELQIAKDLSRCFDLWDRFDHERARELLQLYPKRLKDEYRVLLGQLSCLVSQPTDDEQSSSRKVALRILDLWLNARRRASQARYDDAVARCYRILEWISQWFIRKEWGLETAAIPYDVLPTELQPTLTHTVDEKGTVKLGLLDAWSFSYLKSAENNLTRIFEQEQKVLRNLLIMRNHGILAHGTKPVSENEWKQFANWMEEKLILGFVKEAGIKAIPQQLPDEPCWS